MIPIRVGRMSGRLRSFSMLPFCLALLSGGLLTSSMTDSAKAQAFAAAPLVLSEAIRPVVLSNGFVNIRGRRATDRAAEGDDGLGVAPAVVRTRWEQSLTGKIASLELAVAAEDRIASPEWQAAVERVRNALDPVREAQRLVHHSIQFRWDQRGRDHWQTPLETLARGAGDCEDHAIFKRALLLEAGVDAEDISLLFLRTARGNGHVLVQVETDSGTRIMDNRTTAQRIGRLLPGDQVVAVHQTSVSHVIAGL